MAREKLWRRVLRSIPRTALAAILILAIIQIFVKDACRLPLQSAALIFELLIVTSLNLVYRAREKWEKPKFSLPLRVFLLAEYCRLGLQVYYRREFYYMRLSQVDLLAEVDSQLHHG